MAPVARLATTRASPRIAPSRVFASRSLYPESPGNTFDTGLKLRLLRIATTVTRTGRVLRWARVGGLEGLCRTAGQRLRVTKGCWGRYAVIHGSSRFWISVRSTLRLESQGLKLATQAKVVISKLLFVDGCLSICSGELYLNCKRVLDGHRFGL